MFNRWRKTKQVDGVECPQCNMVCSEDSEECPRCYYQLTKGMLQQGNDVDSEVTSSLFDELMLENEDEDEGEVVDWTAHTFEIDDVTIEVDQYEEDSDSVNVSAPAFASVKGIGPRIEPTPSGEDEVDPTDYVLTKADAPKNVEKFVVPQSKKDDITEVVPAHRVDLVVPLLPSNATEDEDESDEGPETTDPSAVPDEVPEPEPKSKPPALPTAPTAVTTPQDSDAASPPPKLPTIPASSQNGSAAPATVPTTPVLPTQPTARPQSAEFTPVASATAASDEKNFWPWPQSDAFDDLTVRRDLRLVMEAVKDGRNEDAAREMDKLGPHLGTRVDVIFHVGVVLKKLGREQALARMLASANRLHPNDENVATAMKNLGA